MGINHTVLLPKTWLMGPQPMGEKAMKTMYAALLRLMMEPDVLYSAATSGVADKTLVLDTGERKAQKDSTATMTLLRLLLSRSYTSSPVSQYLSRDPCAPCFPSSSSGAGGSTSSGPETWEVVRYMGSEGVGLMGCNSTLLLVVLAEGSGSFLSSFAGTAADPGDEVCLSSFIAITVMAR